MKDLYLFSYLYKKLEWAYFMGFISHTPFLFHV